MSQPAPPLATIAAALRRERERAGISLAELARRAGLAKSPLSQLENATGNPSIETLWSLGVALQVPFSRLVEPAAPAVQLVKAADQTRLHADHADFAARVLATGVPQARRDLYVLELEPGTPREAEAHIPGTVEYLVGGAGLLRAGPAGDTVDIAPGDYASFPGDVPHYYEALEPGTWAVLIEEYR